MDGEVVNLVMDGNESKWVRTSELSEMGPNPGSKLPEIGQECPDESGMDPNDQKWIRKWSRLPKMGQEWIKNGSRLPEEDQNFQKWIHFSKNCSGMGPNTQK